MGEKAVIFSVQRFCLHDGPGIRTTVFFKGCPLHCVWCQNPESQKSQPELAFSWQRCVQCYRCLAICPQQAVLRAERQCIDFNRCDHCGLCVQDCPVQALEYIGREWSAQELLTEVLKDKDFYLASQGGITLSGGEPLLQARFLQGFLPQVKASGIAVNLETCGHASWTHLSSLLPFLDLIYFDLKAVVPARHRELTGQDNQLILDNFVRLTACFPALQPRFPFIPGMNDRPEDLAALAAFLRQSGHQTLHVLPYHNLGESKLEKIATRQRVLGLKRPTRAAISQLTDFFYKEEIDVVVYA